jgi:hypothetical protein
VNPLVAVGILLVSLVLVVTVTMAIENWPRLVQPISDPPMPEPTVERLGTTPAQAAPVDAPSATAPEPTPEPAAATPPPEPQPEAEPEPVPLIHPVGRPEGAVVTAGTAVQLRDRATADVLAAVLFAAYAASRRAGADRAAAWVTAAATPPTADPDRFPPGVLLRGKPARVAELLGHREGGSTWVGLQPSVDIAKGVARTPVKQATLAGLVAWWEHGSAAPSIIRAKDARRIAAAIRAVRPQVDETPWSEPVGRLLDALATSVDTREPVLVGIADPGGLPEDVLLSAAPTPTATPTAPRSHPAHAHPSAPGGPS